MKTISAATINLWLKWLDDSVSALEAIRESGDTISAVNHGHILTAFANTKAVRDVLREAALSDVQVGAQ